MPEGHTVHRLARDLGRLLRGAPVRVWSPQSRFAADASRIDGAKLEQLEAYGKHLFWHWSTGEIGHVHLGLAGRFRVHDHPAPDPSPVVRMRIESADAVVDLTGPAACTVDPPSTREAIIARLGPDPLRRDADPRRAIERIRSRRGAIGALLLDQSVLSGIGNIYRAEALFVNGIHPERPGQRCEEGELSALWDTLETMLRAGVRANRIVTVSRDEVDVAPNRPIPRAESFYVYQRAHCVRCGTENQQVRLAGRPCWFCPSCQPR